MSSRPSGRVRNVAIDALEPRTLFAIDVGDPATHAVVQAAMTQPALVGAPATGDGGSATIRPSLGAMLPPAVVAGAKSNGAKVTVVIANDGSAALSAPVTVQLFVSSDAALDADDTPIGAPVVRRFNLEPGAIKTLDLKLARFPIVPDGDYFLLAGTSAKGAVGGTAASGGTVNIAAAPFVDLTGAFEEPIQPTWTRQKRVVVPLTITNLGSRPATGRMSVTFTGRDAYNPMPDEAAGTFPLRVNLKPGASKTIRFKFTTPQALRTASYHLLASIDSMGALAEKNEANNQVLGTSTFSVFPFRPGYD
jgi:hypothetical protein